MEIEQKGLTEARKLYGYHCAMCHGKDGDGKGDVAEQMKLDLRDWRDSSSISKYTMASCFTSSPMAGEKWSVAKGTAHKTKCDGTS